MRQINYQELETLIDAYTGKEVEVNLSPIKSSNTYSSFRCRNLGDMLEIYDINYDKPTTQELLIPKSDIKEIMYYEGSNIYESVFIIVLTNGQVDLSISEQPTICHKCGKIIDTPYEPRWIINQVGDYGSQFDNEKVTIDFCDNCLTEFLEYKDQPIYENSNNHDNIYYIQ